MLSRPLLFKFAATAAVAGTVAVLAAVPIAQINHEIYIDYNEGWNAYHVEQVMNGQDLYQDHWTPVNYPPLYFYLSAFLSKFFGDPLFLGRYIALFSLAGIAVQIGGLVKTLGGKWHDSAFAGLFFLGLLASMAPHYVAMDDPQLLAQCVSLTGLLLYFASPVKRGRVLQACAAFAASLFIKHNLAALPLAFGIYLYVYRRRDFYAFAAWMPALLALLFGLCQLWSHGRFLHSMLIGRQYSAAHLFRHTAPVLAVLAPSALTIAVVGRRTPVCPETRLAVLYFAVSLLLGMLFSGGAGTDVNVFFDTLISLSILAGLALARASQRTASAAPRVPAYFILLSVLTANVLATAALSMTDRHLHHELGFDIDRREAQVKADVAFIKRYDDPVLCERLLLCYYAGKKFLYDPFLAGQMVLTGMRPEKQILTPIEHQHYTLIQLQRPLSSGQASGAPYGGLEGRHRFTENFLRAVGAHYKLVRRSPAGGFYVPK